MRAVVHGEDEPLHVQHVEPEKIRRADQLEAGSTVKSRWRGVHRGNDVPVQPRDLHVAHVVQAALEEALHEAGLEVILLAGLVDIVEIHLNRRLGSGKSTRGASAAVSARTSAVNVAPRVASWWADAHAGREAGGVTPHAPMPPRRPTRGADALLLLFGHAHGAETVTGAGATEESGRRATNRTVRLRATSLSG